VLPWLVRVVESRTSNNYRYHSQKKEELGGACDERQWVVKGGDKGKNVGYEKSGKTTYNDVGCTIVAFFPNAKILVIHASVLKE